MRKPIRARGEVDVTVGGVPLILCAGMEQLDHLEQQTGGLPLNDLLGQLQRNRISIIKASIVALVIEGDADDAWSKRAPGVADIPGLQGKIVEALMPDLEGNAEAGAESR